MNLMIDARTMSIGESISVVKTLEMRLPRGFGGGNAIAEFKGVLTNTGTTFTLEGEGCCQAEVACSLCLEPVRLAIDFHILENFAEKEAATDDDIIFYDKMIDVTPAIERGIFENFPMKPLCAADCAGLCLTCGANLNHSKCDCGGHVNEQFRELLQLFDDKEV